MNNDNKERMIRGSNGRFFSVDFVKRDGTSRHMTARVGVRKGVTGEGLKFDPRSKGLITVWDTGKKSFRMVNLETLTAFDCGKVHWRK